MASENNHLHFVLVPLMSRSHLIPFTELAKLLARRGALVTVTFTPLNADRFATVLQYAQAFNLRIQFVLFRFPCQEVGLPEGYENLDGLPSANFKEIFFKASSLLKEPIESWLGELESQPSCLVSDICFPWTADTAQKFGIRRVAFNTISCFALLCSNNMNRLRQETVQSEMDSFAVPDIPDKIEFTKAQLPDQPAKAKAQQFQEDQLSSDGILVNTFEELEQAYVEGYGKLVNKIWCVGPVHLPNEEISAKLGDQEVTSTDEHECLSWLNSRSPKSVIYACFGSLANVLPLQLVELAAGLAASNCPFLLIIKKKDLAELERWFLEENFEERIKGRGLIFRGWAPQVSILSHSAIGGFLTHCGWNSTLEGASAGVPMITWPMFAEQFYNEKFIVQVLKIGVRIGVDMCVKLGREEEFGVLVKREEIKKAVEKLMDEGEEGRERREKARHIQQLANKGFQEGGSSYMNLALFIEHIRNSIMA